MRFLRSCGVGVLVCWGAYFGAAFALRPLRVAQDLKWCEYDYPRWGANNKVQLQLPQCSAHRLLSRGRSFHDTHITGLRPFALPRPDALSPPSALPAVLAQNTRRCGHPAVWLLPLLYEP